jgi:hypothetical protein
VREYVWGPGGSFVGAAVDELLMQIDCDGRASLVGCNNRMYDV